MSSKGFINIGPFAQAEQRLDDFVSSMYLQKLYNDTVNELFETEVAYNDAIKKESTDEVIKGLESQIKFLENVVALANDNITSFITDKIYYD